MLLKLGAAILYFIYECCTKGYVLIELNRRRNTRLEHERTHGVTRNGAPLKDPSLNGHTNGHANGNLDRISSNIDEEDEEEEKA